VDLQFGGLFELISSGEQSTIHQPNLFQLVQMNYTRGCGVLLFAVLLGAAACRRPAVPTIAFVPMTTGSTFWEAEHAGAEAACAQLHCRIYWNAPTHEDDVEGQIGLLQEISAKRGKYQGLVLAPDHALAALAPVQRELAAGVPTVIVVSPLALPPRDKLSYIVTNEEAAGEIAARRIGSALGGRGSVAVLGIDPGLTGVMLRLHSLEQHLETQFPGVHIVARGSGAFNAAEAQQATLGVLSTNPDLDAVLSLTSVSTRAAFFALRSSRRLGKVKLLGCDQDSDMVEQVKAGMIDSVLAQNTYRMGYEAVKQIVERLHGEAVPGRTDLPPILITSENAGSAQVQKLIDMNWFAQK
jgi:ribose transport system substrate-binding protein